MSRRWKRQILLFVFAVLIPAAMLVTFAVRLVRQEEELASQRAAAAQRDALKQLRSELSGRLEAIKLRETNRRMENSGGASFAQLPDSAIIFVAPLQQDRIVLPWEDLAVRPHPSAEFTTYLKQAEADEFLANDLVDAERAYRKALSAARSASERCQARLRIGRVRAKEGGAANATQDFESVLIGCDAVTDSDGIAFSLYAAERLLESSPQRSSVHDYLLRKASEPGWLPLIQAYFTRSLLDTMPDVRETARQALSSRIRIMEQIKALARDFHAPLFRMDFPFGARAGDAFWVAYGDEPWLLTIFSSGSPAAPFVLAVSSSKLTPPGVRLFAKHTAQSAALGDGFLDLEVEWQKGRFTTANGRPLALYGTALALVLSTTILAAYLLFRDVAREAQIADMRAHFVASVSHELKTPLTSIRMFAETLAKERPPDDQRRTEYAQTIVNESERLSRLVENLLDSSRIEFGRKTYRKRWVSLADVVRSAANAMQYPLSQKGFALNISIDNELPPLLADEDAIEQAILNLLTNAMKYSGDSRDIDLKLTRLGNEAAIEVVDRGLGIPLDEQQRIFDRFYRVRSASTDRVTGTGLGLTLAHHIVAAHGGRLEVSSAPGRGSTFSVRIPLVST